MQGVTEGKLEEPASQPELVTPTQPSPAPQQLTSPSKQVASPALASQPASISKQGHFVIKDDNKVLVLPLAAHQAALTPAPGSLSPLQPSLLPKPSLQTTPSSSKTYCIQRNPNLQNSPTVLPIQPKSIAPSPLTPTPTPAHNIINAERSLI